MNERPQRNSNLRFRENPCHICGSEEYTWGTSVGGQGGPVYFRPEGGWIGSGQPLCIRKCSSCGNVQFFA